MVDQAHEQVNRMTNKIQGVMIINLHFLCTLSCRIIECEEYSVVLVSTDVVVTDGKHNK